MSEQHCSSSLLYGRRCSPSLFSQKSWSLRRQGILPLTGSSSSVYPASVTSATCWKDTPSPCTGTINCSPSHWARCWNRGGPCSRDGSPMWQNLQQISGTSKVQITSLRTPCSDRLWLPLRWSPQVAQQLWQWPQVPFSWTTPG